MSNKFRVNTLLLSGQTVTANSSAIFINNVAVQPGGSVVGLANSGNLESTGTALQTQITNALGTKVTGASISGGVSITGALNVSAGANITLTQAGANSFSIISNVPQGFSTSGNLESTGTALQNQVTSIKNGTGVFIQNSNLNGLISTGQSDLRYIQTGCSGEFYKASNPSSYITASNLNGLANTGNFISGVSITGGLGFRDVFNINAGSNITLTQQGSNTLSISAAAGGSSTNGVTGISVSGGISISGAIGIVGAYGTNVILSGNTIAISGGGGGAGTTNNTYQINSGSGIFIYRSGIASGINKQFINFPTTLDAKPIVLATLHNDDFNSILTCQISGATPNGFYALLSSDAPTTGYYLDIMASNSQQTGMATNVIVNNNTYNQTTGWYSKSITMENPIPSDNITLFRTQNAIQVQKVSSVIRGAGLGSGLFSIRSDPDRGVAGTELLVGGFSTTGRNQGDTFTNFSNSTISGNNWVSLFINATGETLSGINTTIFYTNLY